MATKMSSWTSNTLARHALPGGSTIIRVRSPAPRTGLTSVADRSGHKFYDPAYKSCTKLFADITSAKFGSTLGPSLN